MYEFKILSLRVQQQVRIKHQRGLFSTFNEKHRVQ